AHADKSAPPGTPPLPPGQNRSAGKIKTLADHDKTLSGMAREMDRLHWGLSHGARNDFSAACRRKETPSVFIFPASCLPDPLSAPLRLSAVGGRGRTELRQGADGRQGVEDRLQRVDRRLRCFFDVQRPDHGLDRLPWNRCVYRFHEPALEIDPAKRRIRS